jgi:hypothetical protein
MNLAETAKVAPALASLLAAANPAAPMIVQAVSDAERTDHFASAAKALANAQRTVKLTLAFDLVACPTDHRADIDAVVSLAVLAACGLTVEDLSDAVRYFVNPRDGVHTSAVGTRYIRVVADGHRTAHGS